MSVVKRLKSAILDPKKVIIFANGRGWLNVLPDYLHLKLMYKIRTGKRLNISNPKTFNEKLQWLKLYDRNPLYSQLVDKYEVRKYVSKEIGDKYLIPLIGVYDNFSDINFEKMPNDFVIKCTHDSGGVIICRDKSTFNVHEAKDKINKSLKNNYFYSGREWPYKSLKPRIICEKLLSQDNKNSDLIDYKFYCFNGSPKYCQVIKDRGKDETIDFYDNQWRRMKFTGLHNPGKPYPHAVTDQEEPDRYKDMIEVAKKLSKGLPFLRVDLYCINGSIYFGELTFFPFSGYGVFDPPEWNYKMGDLLNLPN